MKIKNVDLYACKEPLQNLMARGDMPVKYGYPIAKLARKVLEEIAVIDETRNGLIKKFGTTDPKGMVKIEPESENWNKFVVEYNELMTIDNELPVKKVQLPDNINLPLSDLVTLDPFIEVVHVA
ncbi:MAG: hypothetical protein WC479_11020 [Candidatus Izemoplasmatales bacterium]|jgi:hypothetical protein